LPACLLFSPLAGQDSVPGGALTVAPVGRLQVRRGQTVDVKLSVKVAPGYHVNSNAPEDPFLIPLRLSWDKPVLEPVAVQFPAPQHVKLGFSDKPVAIFSGAFDIVVTFRVPAKAADMGVMSGKLRYQACNDRECLPPKVVPIRFSFNAAD
jgi:hypothetical protein